MRRCHQLLALGSIRVLIALGKGLPSELRRAHCILVEVHASATVGHSVNVADRVLVVFSGVLRRILSQSHDSWHQYCQHQLFHIDDGASALNARFCDVIQEASIILII